MHHVSLRLGLAVLLGVVCTTSLATAQESAVEGARARAKAAPRSVDAALDHGRALRRAGREGDAIAELRRALPHAGKRASAIEWEIARAHVGRRDFSQAMSVCRAMGKRADAAPASRVCAAEAHLLWRRATEANAELAELAKLKDVPADVQYAAHVAEGRARELEVKEREAEAAYRAAIGIAPSRAEARVLLGAMLRRLGKDGDAELKRAVDLDPRDPTAQYELGRTLPSGSPASLSALERAVAERSGYVEALRALTEGYVAAGRLPDAKRTAEAVLTVAPKDVLSQVIAGRVALAEGRADEALAKGEAAHKLMPNAAAAKLLVADAYAKKGEIDLAIEAYQAAIGLDRSDPTPLLNAARACVAAGRPTSAKAFARRATQDFASHGPAWVALGDALVADKDQAGARKAYEAAKKSRGVDRAAVDAKLARLR
jgi:cellulose synthase operon protein C